MSRVLRVSQPLLVVAGFSLWAAGFVLLYSVQSIGCARGWDETAVFGSWSALRLLLIVGFVGLVGCCAVLVYAATATATRSPVRSKSPQGFFRTLAYRASLAALGATVFTFAAVLALSVCD